MTTCDGISCCKHEPEFRAVVVWDGEAHGICTECKGEVPILSVPEHVPPPYPVPVLGTPCGDDVPHQWGGPL